MAGTSNPAIPQLRGTSNPAIPMLRSTSNSAIPGCCAVPVTRSDAAAADDRKSGTADFAAGFETSISIGPAVIESLAAVDCWTGHTGAGDRRRGLASSWAVCDGSGVPADKTAVLSLPTALPTGGSQAVVPVRTVAQPAPVVVVAPAKDKPSDDKKDQVSPRKPPGRNRPCGDQFKADDFAASDWESSQSRLQRKRWQPKSKPNRRAPQLDLSPVPQLYAGHSASAHDGGRGGKRVPKTAAANTLTIGIAVAPSGSVVKAEVMGPAGSSPDCAVHHRANSWHALPRPTPKGPKELCLELSGFRSPRLRTARWLQSQIT